MLRIKLTPYREELGKIYHRQSKGHRMISLDGRYEFVIDDGSADSPSNDGEYDFWIVQGKGVRRPETVKVAPENVLFMATEPRSILIYPKSYLRQFAKRVRGFHLPWYIGFQEDENDVATYNLDYDQLKAMPTPDKPRLISVISSNKSFTQGHIDRQKFVKRLKAHFGDALDVYGRGNNGFDDKWDVVAPYKYHIVIENSREKDYWTEKLGDCYLAESFPFYYGPENVGEFFPEEAFCAIDIKDPEGAIRIIEEQIKRDRYEEAKGVLKECKDMMLDQWNILEVCARECDKLDPTLPKKEVTIYPCKSSSVWKNFWRYTIGRKWYEIKGRWEVRG